MEVLIVDDNEHFERLFGEWDGWEMIDYSGGTYYDAESGKVKKLTPTTTRKMIKNAVKQMIKDRANE